MCAMIRVENLVKKFGDFTAVDNISFEVPKGEIFAFLGPNGAGKTTTIKMLTTLLQADERHRGSGRARSDDACRRRCGKLRHRLSGSEPGPGSDGVGEHGPARRALPRAGESAAGRMENRC